MRRAEVAARIHEAKEHGDITENAEYEDAKNEQAFVEGRIQTLSALIKNAVVIEENHSTTHVQIGSTVTLAVGRRQGELPDRRLGRGRARRGQDLERVARRSRAARPQEGRRGHRQRPGRRHRVQDPEHQLGRALMPAADPAGAGLLGRRDRRPGQRSAGRQRLQDAFRHRPRRQPARRRAARRRSAAPWPSTARMSSSATASRISTRWTRSHCSRPTRSSATWACRWHMCRRRTAAPHPNYARHFATLFLETFAEPGHPPAPLLDVRAVRLRRHGPRTWSAPSTRPT